VRRWLALSLGLALAVAAGLWLSRAAGRPAAVSAEPDGGPHADIDDASRAALEQILEDADEMERREEAAREEGLER
jgi:hypothetical protein